MRWKFRGPKVTSRAVAAAAVAVTASPALQRAEVAAVDREGGGAVAHDLEPQAGVGGQDERAVEEHVGRDRRQQQARCVGSTIGPRAEKA